MFVLAKLDIYGYEDGGERLEETCGPFATREEAEALKCRIEKINLVGLDFRVVEVSDPAKLVSWINDLGMGKV